MPCPCIHRFFEGLFILGARSSVSKNEFNLYMDHISLQMLALTQSSSGPQSMK